MADKSKKERWDSVLETPRAERPVLLGPRYTNKVTAKWAGKVYENSPAPLLTEANLQKVGHKLKGAKR